MSETNTSPLPAVVPATFHAATRRLEYTNQGASERTTTVETDNSYLQLIIKEGDLHVVRVTHHTFGSGFSTLDDNALAALGFEINLYFERKRQRARVKAQGE